LAQTNGTNEKLRLLQVRLLLVREFVTGNLADLGPEWCRKVVTWPLRQLKICRKIRRFRKC